MIKIGRKIYTLEELYANHSDYDFLHYYLGVNKIPCHINSPLRHDTGRDMSLYMNPHTGHIHYRDFARDFHGDTVDLFSKIWHLDRSDTIKKLIEESPKFSTRKVYLDYQKGTRKYKSKKSKLEVKIRNWEEHDIKFWNRFGIDISLLMKARVLPISYFFINNNPYKADTLAYVYIEQKDKKVTYKIYQPMKKTFKWLNNHDKSVISLWEMMPKKGEKLVICSSLKDALCLTSCTDIPAIALQGEGYNFKESVIKELQSRFNKIYICFDNDPPGIKYGKNLADSTGFINIVLPKDFWDSKDIAEMYENNFNKDEVKTILNNLFK